MRIAYLSNSALPSRTANSVHVMKMCQAFSANGHQVTLFARPGSPLKTDISLNYGVNASFDIEFSRYPRIPGVCHMFYATIVARKITNGPLPDLIYARHIYSLYALRNAGSRLIYEVHAPPANPLQQTMEGKLLSHANLERLVVISNSLRREYERLYPHLDSNRILVAHDAAEPMDAQLTTIAEPIWPGRADAQQVGYTGHLYPGKGMEIIAMLASRVPSMDFHVIGGSDEDIAYWKESTKAPNLYFHGFVPHGSLAYYYKYLDIMIAPYQRRVAPAGKRGDIAAWMSPLKLFEYMSARKAIVCSDLPVLREILLDRETALLVTPDNAEAWEQALTLLRDKPGLRETLAARAYTKFLESHTWRKRAEIVLSDIPS